MFFWKKNNQLFSISKADAYAHASVMKMAEALAVKNFLES